MKIHINNRHNKQQFNQSFPHKQWHPQHLEESKIDYLPIAEKITNEVTRLALVVLLFPVIVLMTIDGYLENIFDNGRQ